MSEHVDRYRRVAEGFLARVSATPADKWSAPSPCAGWTARDVVVHVINGHRQVLASVSGEEPEPLTDDADLLAACRQVVDTALAAATDPQTATRTVPSPLGELAVEQVVGSIGMIELLVHTWDLARAVGGDEQLDEDAVQHALTTLMPLDDKIRSPQVFGAKIEPPADADPQTRLLCFVGRKA